MVASAAIGGTLQYGYNLAIMNAPTTVSGPVGVYECVSSYMLHILLAKSGHLGESRAILDGPRDFKWPFEG